ncbi:MAG: DUF1501 domain-containing protein [Rhodothermales bacterium]
MCDHHATRTAPPPGSALEHGEAHSRDHAAWSRRDFLTGLGAAVGGAFMLAGTPVRAFGTSPLLAQLRAAETDRVLVLIQLSGGNDGLNTVVPYENDIYYRERPGIAIAKASAQALAVGQDMGLHPSLAAFEPYYVDGRFAIVQNVGYPSPNLSHFRSTDIWMSATGADTIAPTGWVGRYLDREFPGFDETPTDYPLAVQIGGLSSLMFQGPAGNMGMSLVSPDFFDRLAEDGKLYETTGLPPTRYGAEMAYVRTVANDSFVYASAVQSASAAGVNDIEYPRNGLANNLSIVARLIKGNLGARVYHVSIGGFDTHADQPGQHAQLLSALATSVDAFLQDIAAAGMEERVLAMTFSEFGRRVGQNGSGGTDHGTAAPLFIAGNGVNGGLFGNAPDLVNLDSAGNLVYEHDFRTVYATLLQDWFGLDPWVVGDVLFGHAYEPLALIADPASPVAVERGPLPASFRLEQNYPNPFNPQTTIGFALERAEAVRLTVYDVRGRRVQTLVDGPMPAGAHRIAFDAGRLPSGMYLYQLETAAGVETRQMALVR